MTLNLTAKTPEQTLVKQYLEQNASEELVNKINKGLPVEKDGRALISRKTLDGFIKYASEEARKQVAKGEHTVCVEDSVVFGWAVHYFEEDSIPGTIYNLDGSLYEPPKATPKTLAAKSATTPKAKPKDVLDQISMLDLMAADEAVAEPESEVVAEIEEVYTLPEKMPEAPPEAPITVDPSTGEVLEEVSIDPYADMDIMWKIHALLDNQIEIVR